MTSPLNWQDFLKQAGLPEDARCLHSTHRKHALVRITGGDAESFLHAQLSNSVTGLDEGEVRFAAWCNAKGRVWTLVRYWREGDGFILRMPADQVEGTVKRLKMFVLRSDVQLETMDWRAIQFLGPEAEAQAKQSAGSVNEQTFNIPLPASWPLHEVWSPASPRSDLPELAEDLEPLPRILAGIPEVFAGQREEWIPQMLNLDKLEGIDFRKGCYPGQEIVAKLHYKGGLKQRLFEGTIGDCPSAAESGADVTDAKGKKAGNVVEAVILDKQCWLTAVLRTEALKEQLYLDHQSILVLAR